MQLKPLLHQLRIMKRDRIRIRRPCTTLIDTDPDSRQIEKLRAMLGVMWMALVRPSSESRSCCHCTTGGR